VSDYLDRLADAAAGIRYEALPASTLAAARLVLLDTLGAIVAGSALPENGHLGELAAERSREGRATLLGQLVGTRRRIPVVSWQHAAFLKPANRRLLRATRRLSRPTEAFLEWSRPRLEAVSQYLPVR